MIAILLAPFVMFAAAGWKSGRRLRPHNGPGHFWSDEFSPEINAAVKSAP